MAVGDAKSVGNLAFDPIVPPYNAPLTTASVSDPANPSVADREVGLVFRFPVGADFPKDGRLFIREKLATPRDDNFAAIAASPPGQSDDFKLITIKARTGLLIQGGGVGRVLFIHRGILFDMSGPDVTPQAVVRLAEEIP